MRTKQILERFHWCYEFYLGEFKRYILGEDTTISSRFKQGLN